MALQLKQDEIVVLNKPELQRADTLKGHMNKIGIARNLRLISKFKEDKPY